MHPMELIGEQLVKAIEEGSATGKWVRPWRILADQNPVSERSFSGNNLLLLGMYRYMSELTDDERYTGNHPTLKRALERVRDCGAPLTTYWATLKQWNQVGARVKLDQKGFGVVKVVIGTKETDSGDETYRYFSPYTVFNSVQVEGWTPPEEIEQPKTGEDIVQAFTGLVIQHNIQVVDEDENRAYYSIVRDYINMPPIQSFVTEDAYYATLGHEIIHWTGHKSRQDRFGTDHRGQAYAFEELVAELGSTMLGSALGMDVSSDPNVLAYLGSWSQHLREDKTAGRRALRLASAAVRFLQKGE